MWGLSPSDNNAQINAYKATYGVTNPCAGTAGGGPQAIAITTDGQTFLGYPTYCIVCPDKTLYFDVCWPPTAACFDPYITNCGYTSITANFTSDATDICQYNVVNYSDLSTGTITSWNWTFDGGDPATSTDQNPSVTYNNTGNYDVELEVSDGTNSNTLFLEDYITVEMIPLVMLTPFDDVCLTWPAFELTGGSPAGGAYSGPGVSNGWFDPGSAGSGTHTIEYSYIGLNGCENSAEETILVDPCTGITEFGDGIMHLYPNPTSGNFNLKINYNGSVDIQIVNILGKIVYYFETFSYVDSEHSINLQDVPEGIYFVRMQTSENTHIRKLKLVK